MISTILENTNIDMNKLQEVFPDFDLNRILIDTTDYSPFINLYNIIKDTVTDPRRTKFGHVVYNFWEILTITTICIIFGITEVKYIADFANKHVNQFKLFLELKNGMAKYNTFLRTIHGTDYNEFADCRKKWLDSLPKLITNNEDKKNIYQGKEVSIYAQDGKMVRGSGCDAKNIKPVHIVTNFNIATHEVTGEVVVDKKSNEITANPELIKQISDMSGMLITFDAMG